MKIKVNSLLILSLLFALNVSNALSINGASLTNSTGISTNDLGVYVVSRDGTSFDFENIGDIFEGINLSTGSFDEDGNTGSAGDSFQIIGTTTVTFNPLAGGNTLGSGLSVSLAAANGVDANDAFAVILFDSSSSTAVSSTTVAGDTYSVWTDATWVLPSNDGGVFGFSASTSSASPFLQLSDAADFTGIVSAVPEPSTYALFAGILSIGFVAVRRHRSRSQA